MSRFLVLIMAAAMALFIAGPAVAQEWTVDKSYTFSKDSTVTANTDITVTKEVEITVAGDLEATGGIEVQGDVVFKEMDVQVQDEEVVNKFFELDDSATSTWTINGVGAMNVLEQIQNGEGNFASVDQIAFDPDVAMNVGLQYQVGNVNTAFITQRSVETPTVTNNFAKQIQIGDLNGAFIVQIP